MSIFAKRAAAGSSKRFAAATVGTAAVFLLLIVALFWRVRDDRVVLSTSSSTPLDSDTPQAPSVALPSRENVPDYQRTPNKDQEMQRPIEETSPIVPPPLSEPKDDVAAPPASITPDQRWLRLQGPHPLPHLMWVPVGPLLTGDPHLGDSCWGVLMYLHGAGEAGDDLSLLVTKQGAMGTPPQIIEGHVISDAGGSAAHSWRDKHDGASASTSTHPLRNGSLSGNPFRTVVIAPQSNLGWPYDPHRLSLVAEWIRQLGGNPRGESFAKLSLQSYTLPKVDAHGVPFDAETLSRLEGFFTANGGGSLGVDKSRFVVSGASQGGAAVMELVSREDMIHVPAVFVALCGFSIDDDRIARDVIRRIERNGGRDYAPRGGRPSRPQFVMAHGRNDVVVPLLATTQIVERIEEKGSHHQQIIKVRKGLSIAEGIIHNADGHVMSSSKAVVFFDLETAQNPLDAPKEAAGHAVWRDMFAASSPLWSWLQ